MAREDRPIEPTGVDVDDTRLEIPSRYRVLMLDDGGAPSDIIEDLLEHIFDMKRPDGRHMIRELRLGVGGGCGVYHFEVAETKAIEAIAYAAARNFEIRMTLETV